MASPDASKKFSYSAKDDKISFEVALQGNTYTVEMLRVPETSSSSGSSAASSSSSASSSPASAPSSASSSGSQAGPAALGYEIYDDDLAIAERGYSYDDGTLDYAIKVVNTSSQTTYKYAQVTVSAYDEGGKVLGTSKDTFTEVFPGDKLASANAFSCNEEPARVEFRITSGTAAKTDPSKVVLSSQLEISGTNEKPGATMDSYVGEVTNTSSVDCSTVRVTVLFKKEGEIVGGEYTLLNGIKAGESMAFEIGSFGTPAHDECEYIATHGL